MKAEQLSFEVPDIYTQVRMKHEQEKAKRRWEDRFQKWSNEQSQDGYQPYGCCGTGDLCDYCEDNTYGRPCVRALNALCREKGLKIDYTNYDFKEVWWLYGLKEGAE